MKGITHFTAGMAAASLIPGAIEMAADGSLILLVGGVSGVLPDTIDFKWSRFVEEYHHEIDPHPRDPDPQAIADQLAAALDDAWEADGDPRGLMIHTTRVGADAWRQITVTFDHDHQEVRVKIGPIVTLSGKSIEGTEIEKPIAAAKCKHPFAASYLDTLRVNIFSGPSWELRKQDGETHLNFIAWHRRGTHSLFFGVCLGLICWMLFGHWAFFFAGFGGVFMHMAEDQLGFMGCAAFWPLTIKRYRGLGLWHSGDPLANFTSIWASLALVGWMLNLHHDQMPLGTSGLHFFLKWVFVPMALLWTLRATVFKPPERVKRSLPRPEDADQDDAQDSLAGRWMQNLKEQDVLNEVGGAEGAP